MSLFLKAHKWTNLVIEDKKELIMQSADQAWKLHNVETLNTGETSMVRQETWSCNENNNKKITLLNKLFV